MIQNIQIFNSAIGIPASGTYYGPWTSIGNLAAWSVYFTGLEGNVWVEASDDPNVNTDGVAAIAAPIAPTVSVFLYGALTGQGTIGIAISYIVQGGGETVASTPTSLLIPDGYQLMVTPPILDPLGIAVGYNVYASNGGNYSLQNMPNSSDRFGSSQNGPMGLTKPFIMYNGFQQNGIVPSVTALTGGPAIGDNISGNIFGGASTGDIEISSNGTRGSMSPSALDWGYIRVGKSGANVLNTQGWVTGRYAY